MAKEDFMKKIFGLKIDAEWNVYKRNYGNLLDGVFETNEDAKKMMVEALRFLQKRNAASAEPLLNDLIAGYCQKDNDRAAVFFFSGIAAELKEQTARALQFFTNAALLEPEYYAVYLKTAKIAHREGLYCFAEEYYRKAIQCLESRGYEAKTVASAYANSCYCLTMMRCFEDADSALVQSALHCADLPERENTAAILYAAKGEYAQMEKCLLALSQNETSRYYENTKALTERICAGKHPQFSEIVPDEEEIASFALWFAENLDRYRHIMDCNDHETSPEAISKEISARLKMVFPFYKRDIMISVYKDDTYTFFFADAYALSLEKGFEKIFSAVSASIGDDIRLIRMH
ncbi:MAG: hypothetical protein IJ489_11440 [Clostridia bacterium]|nr:hypothetical protein [Clostridia bacterium]